MLIKFSHTGTNIAHFFSISKHHKSAKEKGKAGRWWAKRWGRKEGRGREKKEFPLSGMHVDLGAAPGQRFWTGAQYLVWDNFYFEYPTYCRTFCFSDPSSLNVSYYKSKDTSLRFQNALLCRGRRSSMRPLENQCQKSLY